MVHFYTADKLFPLFCILMNKVWSPVIDDGNRHMADKNDTLQKNGMMIYLSMASTEGPYGWRMMMLVVMALAHQSRYVYGHNINRTQVLTCRFQHRDAQDTIRRGCSHRIG